MARTFVSSVLYLLLLQETSSSRSAAAHRGLAAAGTLLQPARTAAEQAERGGERAGDQCVPRQVLGVEAGLHTVHRLRQAAHGPHGLCGGCC